MTAANTTSALKLIAENDAIYNKVKELLESQDYQAQQEFYYDGTVYGEDIGLDEGFGLIDFDANNEIYDENMQRRILVHFVSNVLGSGTFDVGLAVTDEQILDAQINLEEASELVFPEDVALTRDDVVLSEYIDNHNFAFLTFSQFLTQTNAISMDTRSEDYLGYALAYFAFTWIHISYIPTLLALNYETLNRIDIWRSQRDPDTQVIDEDAAVENEEQILNDQQEIADEISFANSSLAYLIREYMGVGEGRDGVVTSDDQNFSIISEYLRNVNPNNVLGISDIERISRVFSGPDIGQIKQLDDQTRKSFIEKLFSSGLLDLIAFNSEIADFIGRRFQSVEALKLAQFNMIDSVEDTEWLTVLNKILTTLRQDPMTFSIIGYYFPNLLQYIVVAFSSIVDYSDGQNDEEIAQEVINSLAKAFGTKPDGSPIFTLIFQKDENGRLLFQDTNARIRNVLERSPYRANTSPRNPDIFHLRIGAANFYVPPLTVNVSTQFKTGSLTGGAIRQKSSPKFNSGYRETSIRMRLFFPNYEEIWGISVDEASQIKLNDDFKLDFSGTGDSDKKIDKFLSSLRGLVAAFKYSPILPVKNQYLNTVHGVTGVCLSNMTISTVPNFPFSLAVDLELLNFNHEPFLPMLRDFNQSIHWGKYRQYMGKAAGHLHRYVNEEFLLKVSDSKEEDGTYEAEFITSQDPDNPDVNIYSDRLKTNILNEWRNGNHLTLYVPAEVQTKLFLPDTSSFRSEQEEYLDELNEPFWDKLLGTFGLDLESQNGYGISLQEAADASRNTLYSVSTYQLVKGSLDLLTAGVNAEDNFELTYSYIVQSFINENDSKLNDDQIAWLKSASARSEAEQDFTQYAIENTWRFRGTILSDPEGEDYHLGQVKRFLWNISRSNQNYLDAIVDQEVSDRNKNSNSNVDRTQVQEEVKRAFNALVYERFFMDGTIQALMEAARERAGYFQFNEWEVPMIRVDLDPDAVIINGVSVSLSNNFAQMQLQMQDEPSYQHIGGKDSYINISMTVIGEAELIKIKRIFDHISGLARLEHATGVIGFMGMKNIITALSGIKYVMPLSYQVDTVPNYPHVYSVRLSLVDFDIFQQKREELSSKQQRDLVTHFSTKKNPFLRIKQMWGMFNAYPDFPLDIKNEEGEVVGHLDPDFYFRSFEMMDKDIVHNFSLEQPVVQDYNPGIADMTPTERAIFDATIERDITEILNQTETDQDAINELILELVQLAKDNGITKEYMISRINQAASRTDNSWSLNDNKNNLLTSFINISDQSIETSILLNDVTPSAFVVGDASASSSSEISSIQAALEGAYSLESDAVTTNDRTVVPISFDPDRVPFHHILNYYPGVDQETLDSGRVPASILTAIGEHKGYVDSETGRFYLNAPAVDVTVQEDGSVRLRGNMPVDVQVPDNGGNVHSGVVGVSPLTSYQKAYETSEPQHWETMMVDTQYRDISGRMLRAFPTYMLWLIDEGGYFAGVKLFDNFYGLQSVIDFSVVSSEDLLGDTLVLRVSNLYSKLTKSESNKIFNPNIDDYNQDELSLTDGLASIVNNFLNRSRNILAHMRHEYVVDINNIRLKPGVRVHLRCGYGSNPNSLQTVFNGVITNVEQGEIVTITAQSDAIELGAIVNSTNEKGDSGKIDGGIDTGMWMSEPRDLMVRLLSMGASRTREAIAHATRGTVFSENKFGIRHFGNILYEPLTSLEIQKHDQIWEQASGAMTAVSQVNGPLDIAAAAVGAGEMAAVGAADAAIRFTGFSGSIRGGALGAIGRLMANFASQIDFEIYKRNIYPGNGTGVAQFLGGDLDQGWASVASIRPLENGFFNSVQSDSNAITDISWNRLITLSARDSNAASAVERMTLGNELNESSRGTVFSAGLTAIATGALSGLVPVGGFAATAGIGAGAGLLGSLSGRGSRNFWATMGFISPNSDDDMPGFDEVSFRAQTYMRTVWDIFQTCARLLPNYIVAVRPFEDRSTVFYGKPHWLYTSGVVPITTGYPGEGEDGNELAPRIRQPDMELLQIFDKINSESGALADYSAFFGANEISSEYETLSSSIAGSLDIYAPTERFKGRVVNFYDENFYNYKNSEGQTICKLPGVLMELTAGPHLPVSDSNKLAVPLASMTSGGLHKQINNLPPRYSLLYFSDFSDKTPLFFSAEVMFNSQIVQSGELSSGSLINSSQWQNYSDDWKTLLDLEGYVLGDGTVKINDEDVPLQSLNSYDVPLDLSALQETSVNTVDFNANGYITMPYPSQQDYPTEVFGEDNDNYSIEINKNWLNIYDEWGSPSSPEDEQFYISLPFPYNPSTLEGEDLDIWKDYYGHDELVGSAQDYKNMKILVYNPINRRAVVCRPAFYYWGNREKMDSNFSIRNDSLGFSSAVKGTTGGLVSPDAAYYLGIITKPELDATSVDGSFGYGLNLPQTHSTGEGGFADYPTSRACYLAFVPNDIPVGVISSQNAPARDVAYRSDVPEEDYSITTDFYHQTNFKIDSIQYVQDNKYANRIFDSVISTNQPTLRNKGVVGFGNFSKKSGFESGDTIYVNDRTFNPIEQRVGIAGDVLELYEVINYESLDALSGLGYGGNPYLPDTGYGNYFGAILNQAYDVISEEQLKDRLESDAGPVSFSPIFSEASSISVEAAKLYDEDFDNTVSVIAGNGRTRFEAQDIWNQFRYGYHNYDSVKKIFSDLYGLDPDSESEFPSYYRDALAGRDSQVIRNFSSTGNSALDEFQLILGDDYADVFRDQFIGPIPGENADGTGGDFSTQNLEEAIEFARENFIDAAYQDDGAVASINEYLLKNIRKIRENFLITATNTNAANASISDEEINLYDPETIAESIRTPKQLFLFLVGAFRQKMWQDPYARAWLVLRPDTKIAFVDNLGGGDRWSFKPVDPIFRAYIDPNSDYAKDVGGKFSKLLVSTAAEGNSAGNILSYAASSVSNFFDANIGPIWNAITDGLSGLLASFRLSMQQMGYALSEAASFRKHANIMNKVFNDSIYYSLGREGSILRGVDNPFTREYGEPVLEVREPFQRMHYLNSFSHILNNQIQENLNNVATVVTAVSDRKYPVTVALDKGAPAERQVEKTVETGIYYDNAIGEGFLGIAHLALHPIETFRGISKNVQGVPDELSARRIALAHLKESIKDIYQGELIIMGNADIRPHDLVYLADVYERMYGIFEVEQVVHHFTPEMGYITSITPNALVTVNDPARWFFTSWIHSWFSKMAIRNDTRVYLDKIRSGSSGLTLGGQVSMEKLGQILEPQITGGIQFTHGSSALIKDTVSMEMAKSVPDSTQALLDFNSATQQTEGGAPAVIASTIGGILGGAAITAAGVALTPFTAGTSLALGLAGSSAISQLAWKGWSWVRDNLLDQHGCYVQYLNRNGQPMDAGLSYNQGMVVGRHHTKALLPGILGVRHKARTAEGYSYVRTDDLFKNLGWNETEIDSFVRYTSYQNSLVHARVLGLGGVGPDRASLESVFTVLVKATRVIDGDTIEVQDVISNNIFTVRFDGIDTAETNSIKAKIGTSDNYNPTVSVQDGTVLSTRAQMFTANAVNGKMFLLRINRTREQDGSSQALIEQDFELGSPSNNTSNYVTDSTQQERVVATIFYHTPENILSEIKTKLNIALREALSGTRYANAQLSQGIAEADAEAIAEQLGITVEEVNSIDWTGLPGTPTYYVSSNDFHSVVRNLFDDTSAFYIHFNKIIEDIKLTLTTNYYDIQDQQDLIYGFSEEDQKTYSSYVHLLALEYLYGLINEWPRISWDQYHEDGVPYSLNWELVSRNLAKVYIKDLQKESESVIDAIESSVQMEDLGAGY